MAKTISVGSAFQLPVASASKPNHTSAFDAHGFWSLGVVLMRNLQFTSKSIVICVIFLIPILSFGYLYNTSMFETIEFSAKERLGLEYNREIFPLLDLAQQLRRDATSAVVSGKEPASMAGVKEKLLVAQAKLAEVDKRLGKELDTAKPMAAIKAAFAQVDTGKSMETVFKLHTAHVEALMALISAVTDSSGLTLDPDIDSYFMMDASFFRIPDIVESSGRLRGLGLGIMKSGSATPVQQRNLSERIAIAEFQGKNMREGLAKVFAFNKDKSIEERINAMPTLEKTSDYFLLVRKSVIDAQDFRPENQAAYLLAANNAINAQYQLAQRLVNELDRLLVARIENRRMQMISMDLLAFVAIILAAYLFYAFFIVTKGGMVLMSKHLQQLAEGDLRHMPAKPWGKDEPAVVIDDMRKAYDALHELIRAVNTSAQSLQATGEEVAGASMDLSRRTEAAAAALEQQASTMEEIGTTVGTTAERANMAAEFATENAIVAAEGGKVIQSVVQMMQTIHTSSAKINDIIGVINGIAFQTNILALNAAVEAARAGESGRGFAVVAGEVRNLAQRSAAAASEIKHLISSSVEQISAGRTVVEKAGVTMGTVVTNANQINSFLKEISTSSREEANAVSQAAQTIQELDQNTRHNATLVEETSAASKSLTQQAETLQGELAHFRI